MKSGLAFFQHLFYSIRQLSFVERSGSEGIPVFIVSTGGMLTRLTCSSFSAALLKYTTGATLRRTLKREWFPRPLRFSPPRLFTDVWLLQFFHLAWIKSPVLLPGCSNDWRPQHIWHHGRHQCITVEAPSTPPSQQCWNIYSIFHTKGNKMKRIVKTSRKPSFLPAGAAQQPLPPISLLLLPTGRGTWTGAYWLHTLIR